MIPPVLAIGQCASIAQLVEQLIRNRLAPEVLYRLKTEKSDNYPDGQSGIFYIFLPYFYPNTGEIFSNAALAQLVERLIRNQQIVSSNLTGGSINSGVYVNYYHINPCFISTLKEIETYFHPTHSRVSQTINFYPGRVEK